MPEIPDVRAAMSDVSRLQQELTDALEDGRPDDVDRILAELTVAERRRNRLLQRASNSSPSGFDAAPPIREQLASVLGLLSRPAAVALIKDVATARFGEPIQPSRLASLRRDEQRSWQAANRPSSQGRSLARPAYIVPALTADRFAPVRGMLAMSSWTLEVRIVAPASHRVDTLHVLIRLIDELDRDPEASWAPNIRRMVWRFARSVAGAIDNRDGVGNEQIRDAAERELALIAPDDTAERHAAAERARRQLDPETLLFGSTLRNASPIPSSEASA
jgi:hypothetical protein